VELKNLQKQLDAHIQDYNIKVQWAKQGSSSEKLNVSAVPSKTAVTPNPSEMALDDRGIATAMLLRLQVGCEKMGTILRKKRPAPICRLLLRRMTPFPFRLVCINQQNHEICQSIKVLWLALS
jgi:hypothetical protein